MSNRPQRLLILRDFVSHICGVPATFAPSCGSYLGARDRRDARHHCVRGVLGITHAACSCKPICCRCLQVREEAAQITVDIILTAMDKIKLGLPQRPLEDSPAKRRMITVEVGRAVAIALTPGMPPIENLSTKPRGGVMGRILFRPQVPLALSSISTACLVAQGNWGSLGLLLLACHAACFLAGSICGS